MTGKLAYIMHVRRLKKQFGFKDISIIAMDKTSVWNNMASSATVEQASSFFFFLFFILRQCKFLNYKFANSTINLNSYTN